MSMAGPVTCSALTVIDPLFPPDEFVCSLTTRLMPPGNETARFGLETTMDWPAATRLTIWAFPLVEAVLPLQVALEVESTTLAVIRPPNKFRSASCDSDWLLVPLPDEVLFSASADAKPKTFTLARDVLKFPPLDGRAPVSAADSEIPSAFAFKATPSPLNVVVAWA